MKFMLMMNARRGTGDWAAINWPQEDLKALARGPAVRPKFMPG